MAHNITVCLTRSLPTNLKFYRRNINYNVSVRIALREQSGGNWSAGTGVQYFEVTNASAVSKVPPTTISAATFYSGLIRRKTENDALLKNTMQVSADRTSKI